MTSWGGSPDEGDRKEEFLVVLGAAIGVGPAFGWTWAIFSGVPAQLLVDLTCSQTLDLPCGGLCPSGRRPGPTSIGRPSPVADAFDFAQYGIDRIGWNSVSAFR